MNYFLFILNLAGIGFNLSAFIFGWKKSRFKNQLIFLSFSLIPLITIICGEYLFLTSKYYALVVKLILVLTIFYLTILGALINHYLNKKIFVFSNIFSFILISLIIYGCFVKNIFLKELVVFKSHYGMVLYRHIRNPFFYILLLAIINIQKLGELKPKLKVITFNRILNYSYFFIATIGVLFSYFDHYLITILNIGLIIATFGWIFSFKEKDEISFSETTIAATSNLMLLGIYLIFIALIVKIFLKFGFDYKTFLSFLSAFFAFLFFLALFFSPFLRKRFQKYIEKNLVNKRFNFRKEVTDIMDEFGSANEMEEILSKTKHILKEKFNQNNFLLAFREGRNFTAYRMKNSEINKEEINLDQNFVDWLWRAPDIIEKNDIPQNISIIDFDYLVPIVISQELIALLFLFTNKKKLKQEEKDLLFVTCEQIGLTFYNLKLRKEISEAEKINAFSRTSSFIIHDLKNMATSLSLLLKNAEKHIHHPEFKQSLLKSIRYTVEQMQTMIQKLKMPAKERNMKRVDINHLINEIYNEMGIKLNGKISFVLNLTEPAVILGREEEIKQVISNLITNALEAVKGKGEIRINTKASDNKKGILLEIEDNGIGIEKDKIDKIFEPFYSSKKSGLGIGLYQVKKIIENHGGEISVYSALGKGTKFKIRFPCEVELCQIKEF